MGMQFFFIGMIIVYFLYPELAFRYGNDTAAMISVIGVICGWILYKFYFAEPIVRADQLYLSRPWDMGSDANYAGQTAGKRWTPAAQIKRMMGIREGIEIDRFTYKLGVKRYLFLFSWFGKYFTETPLKIRPIDFTKGSLIIGQQGAGKTEMFMSILSQNVDYTYFQRQILHDVKGDLTQKFYSQNRDIILNPYDNRAYVWDFFGENDIGTVEIFFNAYMKAVQGSKKDFFSGSAQDRYMGLIKEIFFQNIPNTQKWAQFIFELDRYFEAVAELEKSSEKDVAQTMRLQLEFFKLQYFLISSGASTFSLKEFFKSSNRSLFMLNSAEYSQTLNPYFSGFVAALTAVLVSLQDTKENFTLLLLDEYLTFLEVLPDETVTQLHTLIRSKGGCLMAAVQYIPERSGEKNIHQALLNSAYWMFIFETTDNYTIRQIQQSVGKVEYSKRQLSNSNNTKGSRAQESRSTDRVELLDDDAFSQMNFHHITYCRSKALLYRGYTPMVKIAARNKPFEKRDLSHFYLNK